MAQNNNILQELNELGSSLAGLEPQLIYSVPVGYFEGLADQVMSSIKALEAGTAAEELGHLSPLLSSLSKQMPYHVPSGYFEEPGVNQTAKEEIESLSPLLSRIEKKMPYEVPAGYFDSLKIPQVKPAARVISITGRRWFRIAAAAMITGAIVVAGLLYFNNRKENIEAGDTVIAKVKKDVKKMNEEQKDNLVELIALTGKETVALPPAKSAEIKTLLQDISDEELKDFQEQTEDLEDVMMTN